MLCYSQPSILLLTISNGKRILCEVLHSLLQVLKVTMGGPSFDSVLHKENDDDLYYAFSAINMESVECRDLPGLGKFVDGSDVKIDFEISHI